jgi:hypothetical protein
MTTTSPSWMPSWPTSFPDIGAIYDQTIRRQFGNLYDDATSDEYADVTTIAECIGVIAQMSTWIRRHLFPQFDDDALFMDLWESAFGVAQRVSATARRTAIIRAMRYSLGTATKEAVQAIFAPVFQSADDPSTVAFECASNHTVSCNTDEGFRRANTHLHIYDSAEGTEPDEATAKAAIAATKPAHETWTVGRYKTFQWGSSGGTWGNSCWGA